MFVAYLIQSNFKTITIRCITNESDKESGESLQKRSKRERSRKEPKTAVLLHAMVVKLLKS